MKYTTEELQHALTFASESQAEKINAVIKSGSFKGAARELGLADTTVSRSIDSLMAKLGDAHPENNHMVSVMADGLIPKGTSTLIKDGKYVMQWVKTTADDQRREEMFREVIEGLKDEIPKAPPVAFDSHVNEDLLNCYVITDYHLGMLAWKEETKGDDWDVQIAEQMILKWFRQAIDQSPPSKYATFAQLSDFLHFDGMEAVTPASKHLLDADTRFPKLVRVAIRVVRAIISMLLEKHENLHIIMADANHDPVSEVWLREWIWVLYENEPRITVDTTPNPFNAYEFGNVALFFHHGHKRKITNVSSVFVSMYKEMYGRCKYHYAHTGHLHSIDVKEDNLMVVEQHRTLAPNDAYAARGGWLSGRDAQVITYHKNFGEVSRIKINSDILK